MKSQSEIAEEIARKAHAGQFRRDGVTPYITHIERVVARLKKRGANDDLCAAGWLHDVLEDTELYLKDLKSSGIKREVANVVMTLTKPVIKSYSHLYLKDIKPNPDARAVKIQDMLDNLSDNPTRNQIVKYCKGLLYLIE